MSYERHNAITPDFIAALPDRDPAELETLRAEAWRTGEF